MSNLRTTARIPSSSGQYRRKCHTEIRCNRCHIRCADTVARDIHEKFCDGKQPPPLPPQHKPLRRKYYWEKEILHHAESGGDL